MDTSALQYELGPPRSRSLDDCVNVCVVCVCVGMCACVHDVCACGPPLVPSRPPWLSPLSTLPPSRLCRTLASSPSHSSAWFHRVAKRRKLIIIHCERPTKSRVSGAEESRRCALAGSSTDASSLVRNTGRATPYCPGRDAAEVGRAMSGL